MVVEAEQRSQAWLQARLGKPTASRYGDIMSRTRSGYSAGRKNYMAELVAQRLTGTIEEGYTNSAMQWGVDNEDSARLAYEFASGNTVETTGLWLHDKLETGASPDGLVGSSGLVEIKCPNTATHIETLLSKKLPYQYRAQVQGQLWITGREWCDFVSYDPRLPENLQLAIINVSIDGDYVSQLEAEVKLFLKELRELEQRLTNYSN